jgi:hypothetical protein
MDEDGDDVDEMDDVLGVGESELLPVLLRHDDDDEVDESMLFGNLAPFSLPSDDADVDDVVVGAVGVG